MAFRNIIRAEQNSDPGSITQGITILDFIDGGGVTWTIGLTDPTQPGKLAINAVAGGGGFDPNTAQPDGGNFNIETSQPFGYIPVTPPLLGDPPVGQQWIIPVARLVPTL